MTQEQFNTFKNWIEQRFYLMQQIASSPNDRPRGASLRKEIDELDAEVSASLVTN